MAEIAIVSIDDESLKQVSAWPWPRSVHAELVRRLSRSGAKAVVFDAMFAEPGADDAEFARVAKAAGNEFFAKYFASKARGMFASYAPTTNDQSGRMGERENGGNGTRHPLSHSPTPPLVPVAEGAVYPVRALREAAAGVGHVNVLDGNVLMSRASCGCLTSRRRPFGPTPCRARRLYVTSASRR